jgi:hypothetical protein
MWPNWKLDLNIQNIANFRTIRIIAPVLDSVFIICTCIFENKCHFYTLWVLKPTKKNWRIRNFNFCDRTGPICYAWRTQLLIRYFKEVRKNVSIISEQPSYTASRKAIHLCICWDTASWAHEAAFPARLLSWFLYSPMVFEKTWPIAEKYYGNDETLIFSSVKSTLTKIGTLGTLY